MIKTLYKSSVLLIIIFHIPIIFIWIDWLIDDKIPQDKTIKYGLIYWNKVELDWEPSTRLKSRLDTWLELYKKWVVKIIIEAFQLLSQILKKILIP